MEPRRTKTNISRDAILNETNFSVLSAFGTITKFSRTPFKNSIRRHILDDDDDDLSQLITLVQCQGQTSQTSGAAVVDQTKTDHHLGHSSIKHLHPKPYYRYQHSAPSLGPLSARLHSPAPCNRRVLTLGEFCGARYFPFPVLAKPVSPHWLRFLILACWGINSSFGDAGFAKRPSKFKG